MTEWCVCIFKADLRPFPFVWNGGSLKKEPGSLGTTPCELVSTCRVKWVAHWNTCTAHHPNPTDRQVGVPLEHTYCTPPKPHRLVKWVSHWKTLHTTQTTQAGQVGVPLEHTAHHPNPTDWSSGCHTGMHTLHATQTPQTGQVGVPLEHLYCTPPKPHRLVK